MEEIQPRDSKLLIVMFCSSWLFSGTFYIICDKQAAATGGRRCTGAVVVVILSSWGEISLAASFQYSAGNIQQVQDRITELQPYNRLGVRLAPVDDSEHLHLLDSSIRMHI